MSVLTEICDLFFPRYCPTCGKKIVGKDVICSECMAKVPAVPASHEFSGRNWYFDGFFYRAHYSGIMGEIIRAYKYIPRMSLSHVLSDLFLELFERFPPPNNSVITCVPITFDSLKTKGFDHVKRLSLEVSKKINVNFLDLLEVSHQMKSQVGLSPKERKAQIIGKYGVIRKNLYKTSGIVVLLDDVFTTGATVNECSRVLKAEGASKILVYTLAKSTKK